MDFQLGCNYWASHAGVYMWREWDLNKVESDLQALSASGMSILRVFPLWSDFQPLSYVNGNGYYEIRNGDAPLNRQTPEGLAGVDPVMISRFEEFVLLAKNYNMQLIVPLITGWMSGRMFFPPAFEARNPISDYETIKWELRFVKYFVNHFKGFDNIIAWEAGNETNVMSFADEGWKKGNYYVWLSSINTAIRSVDPTRPIISGIHGLTVNEEGITIAETAELCDMLTVHPYAPFVPHCFVDGYTTMRGKLHAVSQSMYYEQIGGKPCLCEEIGHLGNSIGCDETVADYLKANLYALWAHGFPGLLWWCAFDQDLLEFPPYDWCACERELGILRSDSSQKPLVQEILNFKQFLSKQEPLMPYQKDVVCILSKGQDTWAVAYSVNLLCKQAGLDVQFVDGEDPIPDAAVYLAPSLTGDALPRRTWKTLMEKVSDGATMYISWQDAILSHIEQITGMKVVRNWARKETDVTITVPALDLKTTLHSKRRLDLTIFQHTEVLGTEPDGNPALVRHSQGKGYIYFLTFPLEAILADQPEAFENTDYYRIYESMFLSSTDRKITKKSSPNLSLTEHPDDENHCTVVAMNYGNADDCYTLQIKCGWSLQTVQHGHVRLISANELEVKPEANGICRFVLSKEKD